MTTATSGTITAGTHTEQDAQRPSPGLRKLVWDTVSDSVGNGNLVATITNIKGFVHRVVFDPDGGGTQPSASSDWTLTDEHGVDLLAGGGANISNTTNTDVVTYKTANATDFPFPVVGDLTLTGANVGSAKGFTVYIYCEI